MITLVRNNNFSSRKKFLVADNLLYQKQLTSDNRPLDKEIDRLVEIDVRDWLYYIIYYYNPCSYLTDILAYRLTGHIILLIYISDLQRTVLILTNYCWEFWIFWFSWPIQIALTAILLSRTCVLADVLYN